MTNQLPPLPDDNSHLDETIENQPQQTIPEQHRQRPAQQGQPPVPRQQRQPTRYNVERVRRQRQQQRTHKDSILYFPLWSLGLMLLVVLILAFGIVFLVVALGGRTSAPEVDPLLRVITAEATFTPFIPDPDEVVLATPTLPEDIQIVLPAQTPVNLTLDGPVLPTVAFTATPPPLTVGVQVIVAGVGDQELNVRNVPGVTTSQVIFRSPDGTQLTVVDGPQQADGFTWWQVQNPTTQQSGWAVANYLEVLTTEAGQ